MGGARRLPFQQKIGAGLTPEQFRRQLQAGTVPHVGFAESIQMMADAFGWKLERVTEDVAPKIAGQLALMAWVPVTGEENAAATLPRRLIGRARLRGAQGKI